MGRIEGFQAIAIDIMTKRFHKLESLAQTLIPTIEDEERLQTLITDLSLVSGHREACKALFKAFTPAPEGEDVNQSPKKSLSNIFGKLFFWQRAG